MVTMLAKWIMNYFTFCYKLQSTQQHFLEYILQQKENLMYNNVDESQKQLSRRRQTREYILYGSIYTKF